MNALNQEREPNMITTPEGDWRQKRWPIPPEVLQVIQVRLWDSLKQTRMSARRRKGTLKLLSDIKKLRREPS